MLEALLVHDLELCPKTDCFRDIKWVFSFFYFQMLEVENFDLKVHCYLLHHKVQVFFLVFLYPPVGCYAEIKEEIGGNFLGLAIKVFYGLDNRSCLLYKCSSLFIIDLACYRSRMLGHWSTCGEHSP